MINTKLILVDGISGSGKSTIAHFIERHLQKNGIKVKWYHELEDGHPLHYDSGLDDLYVADINDFLKKYPMQWAELAEKISKDDIVYIIDSMFMQNILDPCLKDDFDRDAIRDAHQQICSAISGLNPVVIHFYQNDVECAVRKNWQSRGADWTEWNVEKDGNTNLSKNNNLTGELAAINLWQKVTDLSLELFNNLEFKKLLIENSAQDWDNYRQQIMTFLEVQQVKELLFDNSFSRFCGNFAGGDEKFKIYIENDRLLLDAGWTGLKMLPIGNNAFQLEGWPEVFTFSADDKNDIQVLKITNSLTDDFNEGEELTKI